MKPHAIQPQTKSTAPNSHVALQTIEEGDGRTEMPNERVLKTKSEALESQQRWLHGRAEEARICSLLCRGLVKCPDIQNCGVLWQSPLERWVLKGPTLHCSWSDGRVGRRWWTNRAYMLFTAVRRWSSLTPVTLPPGFLFSFFCLFKFQQSCI